MNPSPRFRFPQEQLGEGTKSEPQDPSLTGDAENSFSAVLHLALLMRLLVPDGSGKSRFQNQERQPEEPRLVQADRMAVSRTSWPPAPADEHRGGRSLVKGGSSDRL